MRTVIVLLHGDNEHECIKEDDGRCSLICPNNCTEDMYLVKEAVLLGLPYDKLHCAIGEDIVALSRKGEAG